MEFSVTANAFLAYSINATAHLHATWAAVHPALLVGEAVVREGRRIGKVDNHSVFGKSAEEL